MRPAEKPRPPSAEEVATAEASKLPGALPTPIASFDLSDVAADSRCPECGRDPSVPIVPPYYCPLCCSEED